MAAQPAGHIWLAKLFCVACKVFLRRCYSHGKAYLAFSGKYKGLNQNLLLFGFPEISSDLQRRPFFFVFTYFWGQIPEILAKVSTDFVQQTCNYLEINFGKKAYGPQ